MTPGAHNNNRLHCQRWLFVSPRPLRERVIRRAHGPTGAVVMSHHCVCVVVGFLRTQCAPQTIWELHLGGRQPTDENTVFCHGQPYDQGAVVRLRIDHGWRPRVIMRSGGVGYAGGFDALRNRTRGIAYGTEVVFRSPSSCGSQMAKSLVNLSGCL